MKNNYMAPTAEYTAISSKDIITFSLSANSNGNDDNGTLNDMFI